MAGKNFSLKDIQLLADQFSQVGNKDTVALFQTILSFYSPGERPADKEPIGPQKLLETLKESGVTPDDPEQTLSWLSSLREKLNRELFDIISIQKNPAELIVGSNYTFTKVLENPQPKTETTPTARKFKDSEITFNLPDELKLKFEQQLERLKERQEQTNAQMQEILAKEKEWEYVASDFGESSPDQFFWDESRVVEFCNIEESGILDTLPVDHFPENEYSGGIRDLFCNVFEWVQDTHDKKLTNGSSNGLEYKVAKGGSYITHFKNIASWRRISFLKSYCTSFLGFRTVCDDI